MSKGNESKRPLRPQDFTDARNAARFAHRFRDRIRFCLDRKSWFIYDGRRWRQSGGPEIRRLALEVVSSLWDELGPIKETADRYRLERAIGRCESKAAIVCMVSLAESSQELEITKHQLDQHPLLLNCLNGTVDLTTGELQPHRPTDYLTKLARVEYHQEASCPRWDQFLDQIMDGNAELVAYLRRIAGYALTSIVKEEAMFFLFGDGRNGKGKFVGALLHVMHEYGMNAVTHLITSGGSHEHPTSIADLDGMRLVSVSEPHGGQLDEELVKCLTGGDGIRARKMHRDNSEFRPTHKLFLLSNSKPIIRGQDEGIWSRIRLIHFPINFQKSGMEDKDLESKLHAEAEGILAWMVRGCLEWQRDGMQTPEAVVQATANYRHSMDPVKQFITERCVAKTGAKCRSADLHVKFLDWCKETRTKPGDQQNRRAFDEAVERNGFRKRKSSTMHFDGLYVVAAGKEV